MPDRMLKGFLSYSHRGDQSAREAIVAHLTPLEDKRLAKLWWDRSIAPGADWSPEIARQLLNADFALLVVDGDYLAPGTYIRRRELPMIRTLHSAGELAVIPLAASGAHLSNSFLGSLNALPWPGKTPDTFADIGDWAANVARQLDEYFETAGLEGLQRSTENLDAILTDLRGIVASPRLSAVVAKKFGRHPWAFERVTAQLHALDAALYAPAADALDEFEAVARLILREWPKLGGAEHPVLAQLLSALPEALDRLRVHIEDERRTEPQIGAPLDEIRDAPPIDQTRKAIDRIGRSVDALDEECAMLRQYRRFEDEPDATDHNHPDGARSTGRNARIIESATDYLGGKAKLTRAAISAGEVDATTIERAAYQVQVASRGFAETNAATDHRLAPAEASDRLVDVANRLIDAAEALSARPTPMEARAHPPDSRLRHLDGLRSLREQSGHTQRAFAERLGVSERWLRELEIGGRRASAGEANRIRTTLAEAFGSETVDQTLQVRRASRRLLRRFSSAG